MNSFIHAKGKERRELLLQRKGSTSTESTSADSTYQAERRNLMSQFFIYEKTDAIPNFT